MGMPRLALARRFRGGEDVVDALDRLTSRKDEPLTAAPRKIAAARHATARGTGNVSGSGCAGARAADPGARPPAAAAASRRAAAVARPAIGSMEASRVGVGRDVDSQPRTQAPSAPAGGQGSRARPGFGFDAFALTAEWTEELGAAQDSLVEEPSGEHELARLIDRLTVKLGPRAVQKPQPRRVTCRNGQVDGCGRNCPPPAAGEGRSREAAEGRGGVSLAAPSPHPSPAEGRGAFNRPQRLLDRPEAIDVIYATPEGMPRRFVWRRAVHDIARVEGPERIAPEWWRQPSSARLRDYYRVEDRKVGATGSIGKAWSATVAAGRPTGTFTACSADRRKATLGRCRLCSRRRFAAEAGAAGDMPPPPIAPRALVELGVAYAFLLPARSVGCDRAGADRACARHGRDRHCRPQHACRRGADAQRLHGRGTEAADRLPDRLDDASSLLAYPIDRDGYGRLSRLLSFGKMRAEKGEC